MNKGCSVFVGNIDFEVDEQTIIKELSSVGKVNNFRMMFDKNTGKSKGYGFCEYESPEVAETAMRTLRITFNGRPVKINYAENDLPQKFVETEAKPLQIDNILKVIDNMDETNLREVIFFLKGMAIDQPTQLHDLLSKNPNLVCGIMYVLIKTKLTDPKKVLEILNKSFSVNENYEQIKERIVNIKENEIIHLSEETKDRIYKLKTLLNNKINDIN